MLNLSQQQPCKETKLHMSCLLAEVRMKETQKLVKKGQANVS